MAVTKLMPPRRRLEISLRTNDDQRHLPVSLRSSRPRAPLSVRLGRRSFGKWCGERVPRAAVPAPLPLIKGGAGTVKGFLGGALGGLSRSAPRSRFRAVRVGETTNGTWVEDARRRTCLLGLSRFAVLFAEDPRCKPSGEVILARSKVCDGERVQRKVGL